MGGTATPVPLRRRLRVAPLVAWSCCCRPLGAASGHAPPPQPPPPPRPLPGALVQFPPRTAWFNATLDHFRYDDNREFQQKYLVYDRFWEAPSGPILLYLGNEGQVEDFYDNTGFMFEIAPALRALVVFVEHRYYGATLPFGNASLQPENLHYLTIEQAMADFAVFVSWLRADLGCPSSACGVVLFGGSYGGMLAAWFRVKYPHLSVGALASSAPVDFYQGRDVQKAFWSATLHTFRKYDDGAVGPNVTSCADRIEEAYAALMARAEAGDLAALGALLGACEPLGPSSAAARAQLAQYVRGALSSMAMVDYPVPTDFVGILPANPVAVACSKQIPEGEDGSLLWLNSAMNVFLNYTGQMPCHDFASELVSGSALRRGAGSTIDMAAWNYQACTELPLEPLTSDGLGFYPPDDDMLPGLEEACFRRFGVRPRPSWMPISTGASSLQFASNIIFSNGEKDPWRVGAPDGRQLGESVIMLDIADAAHHEDLRFTTPWDPPSVVEAKAKELGHIREWLGLGRQDDAAAPPPARTASPEPALVV